MKQNTGVNHLDHLPESPIQRLQVHLGKDRGVSADRVPKQASPHAIAQPVGRAQVHFLNELVGRIPHSALPKK